jgi:stage V sporulation protein SpoVS
MLEQAGRELDAGDVLQASEKGWGAAAHTVKAIAEQRGWRHERHGDLFRVAGMVADELEQPRIRDLFRLASTLRTNFYEGWLTDEDVESGLEEVRELLSLLEEALFTG